MSRPRSDTGPMMGAFGSTTPTSAANASAQATSPGGGTVNLFELARVRRVRPEVG
jgi:hypothetical protein